MNPLAQIALRLACLTLGLFPAGSRILRQALLRAVRSKERIRYVAHADFLDVRDLSAHGRAEPIFTPEDLRA